VEGKPYCSRPAQSVSINLSFDRETALLLNDLAPTKKSRSAFLARLLHVELARREERARVKATLATAEEEGIPG
jgi:hypothetical protein